MFEIAEPQSMPVSQAKAGDAGAWDTLLRHFRMPLYIYIFQWVRNEQTSYDLAQETMLSAIRHIEGLHDDDKFGPWLFGIAHQKCLQFWRKQNREDEAMQEFAEAPADYEEDPRQTLVRREKEAQFLRLLEVLTLPQRSVLVLYYIEEFSLEEIASITGVTLGTIKSRLHYARKAFKDLWERESL
jgi:RNA polymerase sigma-70 factor (ECF subfamily)